MDLAPKQQIQHIYRYVFTKSVQSHELRQTSVPGVYLGVLIDTGELLCMLG